MTELENIEKKYFCIKCKFYRNISEFYSKNDKIIKPCKICKRELSRKNREYNKLSFIKKYYNHYNIIKDINNNIVNNNTDLFISVFNCCVSDIIHMIDGKISKIYEYNWENFGILWEIDLITIDNCYYTDGELSLCSIDNLFPSDISLNNYIYTYM